MANWFPPSLDDGDQLFPPSDMFLRTQISCKHHHRSFLGSSSSCMDELDIARRLAALSLLQNHSSRVRVPFFSPQPPPPSITQRVKPVGRGVSLNHVARGCCSLHESGGCGGGAGLAGGGRLRGYGTGRLSSGTDPVYEFEVRPKVDDGYLEAKKARTLLQRQQNRVPSRIYPFQGNGLGDRFRGGGGGGGSGRESGGTGVFHPRVANHPSTITDDKRKQGARVRQEVQAAQQRDTMDTMRRFGVSKQQEDCHYHLPPDMGLPRDWTY